MRITPQTEAVLKAIQDNPAGLHYCQQISRITGLKTGTVAPILARLTGAGVLQSHLEDQLPHERRPRRRYYQLTPAGAHTPHPGPASKVAPMGEPGADGEHVTAYSSEKPVTLAVYLAGGQVIRFPADTWTTRISTVTGRLMGLGWTTPAGATCRPIHIDTTYITAITEEQAPAPPPSA